MGRPPWRPTSRAVALVNCMTHARTGPARTWLRRPSCGCKSRRPRGLIRPRSKRPLLSIIAWNDHQLSLGQACCFEFDDGRDRLRQRRYAADRWDELAPLDRFGDACHAPGRAARQLPAISAPRIPAICTATRPTPPRQPVMKTRWPACSFALSINAFQAVALTMGKAAASSNERDCGLRKTLLSSVTSASANVPDSFNSGSAEHLVADLEPRHIRTHCLYNARKIMAEAVRKLSTRHHLGGVQLGKPGITGLPAPTSRSDRSESGTTRSAI